MLQRIHKYKMMNKNAKMKNYQKILQIKINNKMKILIPKKKLYKMMDSSI